MKIEVPGPGCPTCDKLHENTLKAVAHSGPVAEVEKVSDIMKNTRMGMWATPGLAIDGAIAAQGRLLSVPEAEQALKNHVPQDR